MKKMNRLVTSIILIGGIVISGCSNSNSQTENEISNKDKTLALLKGIEKKDTSILNYIDSDKYIEHDPEAADGIEGFKE